MTGSIQKNGAVCKFSITRLRAVGLTLAALVAVSLAAHTHSLTERTRQPPSARETWPASSSRPFGGGAGFFVVAA